MSAPEDFSRRIEEAIKSPKNLGELEGADAVGTVGSADCDDALAHAPSVTRRGERDYVVDWPRVGRGASEFDALAGAATFDDAVADRGIRVATPAV